MWIQILSALTLEIVDGCRSTAGIIHGYVDHLACCYIENLIRPLFISHFLLTIVHTQYPFHFNPHRNWTLLCLLSSGGRRYKRKYSLLHNLCESAPCSYDVSDGKCIRNKVLKSWHNKIANTYIIYSNSYFPYQYISSRVPPTFARLS